MNGNARIYHVVMMFLWGFLLVAGITFWYTRNPNTEPGALIAFSLMIIVPVATIAFLAVAYPLSLLFLKVFSIPLEDQRFRVDLEEESEHEVHIPWRDRFTQENLEKHPIDGMIDGPTKGVAGGMMRFLPSNPIIINRENLSADFITGMEALIIDLEGIDEVHLHRLKVEDGMLNFLYSTSEWESADLSISLSLPLALQQVAEQEGYDAQRIVRHCEQECLDRQCQIIHQIPANRGNIGSFI